MWQKLKTTFEFTKNLFVTGAFTETSRKVEIEICRYVPTGEHKVVVEYGMGHGNITREILRNLSPTSKVYAFEVKKEFCEHVQKTIDDDRLIIINDGAENVRKYVKEEVHSVIASIPFSFFSKEMGLQIIQDSYDLLASQSFYSQVLYTRFNFKKFQAIFEDCTMKTLINIPIEYIYHCQKIKKA
ncbi:MAG: hypothetical protein KDC34_17910 [Saprospiraceae bacterium]|nr:hypothetical protein [Saprospiraceae bacterium]